MKVHHAAERLFLRAYMPAAGIALAALRIGFAWALFALVNQIAALFPTLLADAAEATAPFVEIFSLGIFSGAAKIVLYLCFILIAVGLGSRPAALVTAVWFLAAMVLASKMIVPIIGVWTPVWIALMMLLLATSWSRVWGGDDVVLRLVRPRNRLARWLLSSDEL